MAVNEQREMRPDWAKGEGLLPAIVQDATTGAVLMLGYMNEEALRRTQSEGRVTFYSRSKARLWTKGETSGNFLELVSLCIDCDQDAILVQANPKGPTCHNGTTSCFAAAPATTIERIAFLARLEGIIAERSKSAPEASYTAKLLAAGPHRIAQKVGEEGVEVALASVGDDNAKVISESADLLYHLLVLLKSRGLTLAEVTAELASRH